MGGGASPFPASQSLSHASETAITQLRAFVRYELPPAPTDAELADALCATHNSVYAAYHVLRGRRQQQQQQQQKAAAMAAPTPTPATTSVVAPIRGVNGPTVTNGRPEKGATAKTLAAHALKCSEPLDISCEQMPKCDDVRRLMQHSSSCSRAHGCFQCEQLKGFVRTHAVECPVPASGHCVIPLCDALRREYQSTATPPAPATTTTPSNKRRPDDSAHDAPSKRQRESASLSPPPPVARSLRLSSTQDAAMASPASAQPPLTSADSSQKPRLPHPTGDEVHIVFSHRNLSQDAELSQEDEARSAEHATQQSPAASQQDMEIDVVVAPVADIATATKLLSRTISDRRDGASTDATWTSRFWEALGVAVNPEVERRLELVCDAVVAWLQEIDEHDGAAREAKALELILDIAAKLPRADGAGELAQRVAAYDVKVDESELSALRHELDNPSAANARMRSRAAERAIKRLTDECAANLDRIVWFADTRVANATYQADVREQLGELHARLKAATESCSAEVRAGDSSVAESRHSRELLSVQFRELVQKRCEELLVGGEPAVSAEVDAWLDMLNSDDLEIVALLQSRAESRAKIRVRDCNMQKFKKELVFAQRAAQLFATVRELRELALQAALTSFDASRLASDKRATDALLVGVPILVTALEKFYDFHAAQQARANAEVAEQQRALNTHLEYFGDSAPTTEEDMQKRIREFIGVVSRSTQTLLQLADSQSSLWETRKAALPRAVRCVVVREYGRLWRQLSGPFHDVMRKFVEKMRLDADDASDDDAPATKAADVGEEKPLAPIAATAATPLAATQKSSQSTLPAQSSPGGLDATSRTKTSSSQSAAHVSPMRVVDLSMTQEVASFLQHAEPVSSTFAIASALAVDTAPVGIASSPPKAPVRMPAVPPAPLIPVAAEPDAGGAGAAHRFPVGTVLYTKFGVGKDEHFVRGRVEELLADGAYSVAYDNGNVFAVRPEFLHTEAQVERDLEFHKRNRGDDSAASSANEASGEGGGCAIM